MKKTLDTIVKEHYDKHWWYGLNFGELEDALMELAKEVYDNSVITNEEEN